MYPIRGPGTPLPADPGLPPRTHISPAFSLLRPTMQLNNVVLPHPLAPSKPYLETKFRSRTDKRDNFIIIIHYIQVALTF